jgi:hypothetical protein
MALRWYTVVIDCHDVAAQAAWWREALDWQVVYEAPDEAVLIPGNVDVETVRATPWERRGPGLVFVKVPESNVPEVRVGKPPGQRIHLDLHHGFDDDARAAEVERLIGLGAVKLWDGEQGPQRWVTMADPEGNVFCVA